MIEKLALGAVQFGLDYGISNKQGKTSLDEVSRILNVAEEYGITTIDTASAYGNSEEVLGQVGVPNVQVISKFPELKAAQTVSEVFQQSLDYLKVESMYGYIAHSAAALLNRLSSWKELSLLKEEGKLQKIGYSIYTPEELEKCLDAGMIPDLIQTPYSILDQRFKPYFQQLKSMGTEIHTRSTFLQGLFFMNSQQLPAYFGEIKGFMQELEEKYPDNATRASFLLYSCLSEEHIDKVVIGVNNTQQLLDNIKGIKQYHAAAHQELSTDIAGIDPSILLPYNWPK